MSDLLEDTELESPIGELVARPWVYRKDPDTGAFTNGVCSIRDFSEESLSIQLKADFGPDSASCILELGSSKLRGSAWYDALCLGLITKIRIAYLSSEETIDLTGEMNLLSRLARFTMLVDNDERLQLSFAERRAINYLRSATGWTEMWFINLAGPIRLTAPMPNGQLGFREIWSGWELPRPLSHLRPTIYISSKRAGDPRRSLDPAFVVIEDAVEAFTPVSHMQALGELASFFDDEVIAELHDFALELETDGPR